MSSNTTDTDLGATPTTERHEMSAKFDPSCFRYRRPGNGDDEGSGGTILNPSAVGNPDETPVVYLGPALARLMGRCTQLSVASGHDDGKCGGVNGFHAADCPKATP